MGHPAVNFLARRQHDSPAWHHAALSTPLLVRCGPPFYLVKLPDFLAPLSPIGALIVRLRAAVNLVPCKRCKHLHVEALYQSSVACAAPCMHHTCCSGLHSPQQHQQALQLHCPAPRAGPREARTAVGLRLHRQGAPRRCAPTGHHPEPPQGGIRNQQHAWVAHLPHLSNHVSLVAVSGSHIPSCAAASGVGDRGNSFHRVVCDRARLWPQELQHQQGGCPSSISVCIFVP